MNIPNNPEYLFRPLGDECGITIKVKSCVVGGERQHNDTMIEEVEGCDEGVWMDEEDDPPDDLRYNGEGKKHRCMNRKHAEDSFEPNNSNISKVRNVSRNTIAQSKTQAKPINLSRTTHPQF